MAQSGSNYDRYGRSFYLRHRERLLLRDRKNRIKNRKNKLCKVCSQSCLNLERRQYCSYKCYEIGKKQRNAEWKRNYYRTGWFIKYKKSLGGCSWCGYNKCLAALDFHHINPKEKQSGSVKNCSEETGMKELKKCILICANCHREETWKNKYYGDTYSTN